MMGRLVVQKMLLKCKSEIQLKSEQKEESLALVAPNVLLRRNEIFVVVIVGDLVIVARHAKLVKLMHKPMSRVVQLVRVRCKAMRTNMMVTNEKVTILC